MIFYLYIEGNDMSRTLIQEGLIALKEDYKVDYGGATPFNNAFRRYMSDFYPPGQDNKGRRMQDVRNALLGHKLGLIGTEDINKLQQTYNQREKEAGRQQNRDQYLNPEYQKKMRDIYRGKVSPSELGTVPGGEGTLANKKYNDALRRRNSIQSFARKMLGDFANSKSPLKPGIQEDIGPKTSKQSIRPYTKRAARGLNEARGAGVTLNSPLTMVRPGSSLAPGNFLKMRMPFRNKGVETSQGRRFIGTGSSESSRSMLQRPNVNPRTSEGSTREAIKQTRNPDYDAAEIQKQKGTVGDSTSIRADTGRAKSPEKPRGNNPEDIPGLGGDMDGRYIPMLAKPDVM